MASDKSISSRLLTMKFMQRGILNSPTASPSHQRGGSSKRQRLSADGASRSRQSDADIQSALQNAIADEEAKRVQVMERVAQEKGDTRWVLSVQRPGVVPRQDGASGAVYNVAVAGFADIDERDGSSGSESGGDEEQVVRDAGRRTYGQVATSNKDQTEREFDDGSGSEDDSEDRDGDEDDYDPSSVDALIAEAQSAAGARGTLPSKQKSDYMPTSISGGGGGSLSNRSTPRKSFQCYKCGKPGHIAKLCPNR